MKKYTIDYKHIKCPAWDCEVTLSAKYYLDENDKSKAHLAYAECPIVENSKLPEKKQNKQLSYYPSCRIYPCKEISNFASTIEI